MGDDILHSLVSLHQKGIRQVPSCRERWNGDIDTDKVSQYFYRDMVVPWRWMVRKLGPDVPLHLTAFNPAYKMQDRPRTPPETLSRARHIAMAEGLRFFYTGNVHDAQDGTTFCPQCQTPVLVFAAHGAGCREAFLDVSRLNMQVLACIRGI